MKFKTLVLVEIIFSFAPFFTGSVFVFYLDGSRRASPDKCKAANAWQQLGLIITKFGRYGITVKFVYCTRTFIELTAELPSHAYRRKQ